jgi:hypothetical protein
LGFGFVARQKRITVDHEDYYLDLLFFHRKLRRLVAVDLKLGAFKAADKGQMELYLRWLEKNEMQHGEETPIGLILCVGKSSEQVELLQLHKSSIRVAEYMLVDCPGRCSNKGRMDVVFFSENELGENESEVEAEPIAMVLIDRSPFVNVNRMVFSFDETATSGTMRYIA